MLGIIGYNDISPSLHFFSPSKIPRQVVVIRNFNLFRTIAEMIKDDDLFEFDEEE